MPSFEAGVPIWAPTTSRFVAKWHDTAAWSRFPYNKQWEENNHVWSLCSLFTSCPNVPEKEHTNCLDTPLSLLAHRCRLFKLFVKPCVVNFWWKYEEVLVPRPLSWGWLFFALPCLFGEPAPRELFRPTIYMRHYKMVTKKRQRIQSSSCPTEPHLSVGVKGMLCFSARTRNNARPYELL